MSLTQSENWLNSGERNTAALTQRTASRDFSPKSKALISPLKDQTRNQVSTAFEFCP